MPSKLLVIFAVFSLLCQVVFSIYYSTAIVDQNLLFNSRESSLNQLNINNQRLEIKLATVNSLSNFLSITQNKPYSPITSTINLN